MNVCVVIHADPLYTEHEMGISATNDCAMNETVENTRERGTRKVLFTIIDIYESIHSVR